MSLFPFVDAASLDPMTIEDKSVPVEYEMDFSIYKLTGKKVYGNEAIKVWVHKVLRTKRYRHLVYTWDYGTELEDLISKNYNKDYIESEIYRNIKEALCINPYIKDISNFSVKFDDSIITLNFKVITEFGEVSINGY